MNSLSFLYLSPFPATQRRWQIILLARKQIHPNFKRTNAKVYDLCTKIQSKMNNFYHTKTVIRHLFSAKLEPSEIPKSVSDPNFTWTKTIHRHELVIHLGR